ncbi:hypothetical protein B0H14DRAFT_2620975 [Mycena olivaceomarginata]|nr:hypothetical protein B0H14DRAFT_2620975 [Mycena olivaceomarginata]
MRLMDGTLTIIDRTHTTHGTLATLTCALSPGSFTLVSTGHSCDVAKESAKAPVTLPPKPYPDPSAPAAFDGAKVVTFIPGRLEPITSVLLRDGLVPVSDPSSRVTRIPHTIRPKKTRTWAEHDEELLARFALSKSRRNAGKSSNRAESSFQRQQEEEAHYGRVLAQKELEEIVAPRRIS